MLEELNSRFGGEAVRFAEGNGGLLKAVIENDHAIGEMYLHGAQVTRFHSKAVEREVLWLSSESRFAAGEPIRGGVPICWPWFAQHPEDASMPFHGFARSTDWRVVGSGASDNGATHIDMELHDNDSTREIWPHAFRLAMRCEFGSSLRLQLQMENRGDAPFGFTAALHTYFGVDQIDDVVVRGLAGRTFLDKVDGGHEKLQSGPLGFNKETDRIYLGTTDAVAIEEKGEPRVAIEKAGSESTVVWNPWIGKSAAMPDFPNDGYKTMVCVETTNADRDGRNLAAGGTHRLEQTITPS